MIAKDIGVPKSYATELKKMVRFAELIPQGHKFRMSRRAAFMPFRVQLSFMEEEDASINKKGETDEQAR